MTWPSAATKAHLDQGTDDPKQARAELVTLIDEFNALQAHVSSFMQSVLDDADAATARASLGLAIGTNVQAYAALLQSLSGLSVVSGDILYGSGASAVSRLAKGTDGQVLTLASGLPSWAAASGVTWPASQSASGSAVLFTGIPSTARLIYVAIDGVSMNGTDNLLIQLGSGGIDATGYSSGARSGDGLISATTGFILTAASAASEAWSGVLTISRVGSGNAWAQSGVISQGTDADMSAGGKTLSGALDRLRLTTSGANTFDAGTVQIGYLT